MQLKFAFVILCILGAALAAVDSSDESDWDTGLMDETKADADFTDDNLSEASEAEEQSEEEERSDNDDSDDVEDNDQFFRRIGRAFRRVGRFVGRVARGIGRVAGKVISVAKKVMNSPLFGIVTTALSFTGIGGVVMGAIKGSSIFGKIASSPFVKTAIGFVRKAKAVYDKVKSGNVFGFIKGAIGKFKAGQNLLRGKVGQLLNKGISTFNNIKGKITGALKYKFDSLKNGVLGRIRESLSKSKTFQMISQKYGEVMNSVNKIVAKENFDARDFLKKQVMKYGDKAKTALRQKLGAEFGKKFSQTKVGQAYYNFREKFRNVRYTMEKAGVWPHQKADGTFRTQYGGGMPVATAAGFSPRLLQSDIEDVDDYSEGSSSDEEEEDSADEWEE